MTIIVGRGREKATQRIEITDPTVSREHCWLSDNGDGTFTLENKSAQGTIVNGVKILKTTVRLDTVIQLSPTTSVRVADLLPLKPGGNTPSVHPKPGGGQPQPPEFSVAPLENIWKQYNNQIHVLQDKQRKIGLLVRIPMMCTAFGGILTGILSANTDQMGEFRWIAIVFSGISLCTMIFGFIQQSRFNFAQEKEELDTWLQNHYSCPNPRCHHFVGNMPYNVLRQNKRCSYCGCRYKV